MTRNHPYYGKPDYQFWRKEPAAQDMRLFDPVGTPSFVIGAEDKVVTAGSCFAQHVARFLAAAGFNFLVTEQPHPILDEKLAARFNYGLFSARYGNIYSSRQLRQLLERAYGQFVPADGEWLTENGRWVDPFRPQILPGGYNSPDELALDRQQHLSAVRQAVEEMSVFVFTLGLTEIWTDSRDGAVYPLAPGVAGGQYDETIHRFHNMTVSEVAEDLQWSLDFIRERNPDVKFVITVSPVPLNATALDRHVAVSTTYSKACAARGCGQITAANALCDYFPSYEIITTPFTRSAYFAEDLREIEMPGVEHVMSLFLRHYGQQQSDQPAIQHGRDGKSARAAAEKRGADVEAMLKVLCDEEAIDNA